VKEDYIRDDCGLSGLCWSGSEAVESRERVNMFGGIQTINTYMQAPMKLLYEFALARQILLPMQIRHDEMRTGRLPKHV
jgi:hypothetical protein